MIKVPLTSLIAPSFYEVHHSLKDGRYTHYFLKGGRGSTKSSSVSVEIILGMMLDPNANAVVLRKVKETLRESVFEQLSWAIDKLGVSHKWDIPKSKLELTYLPTSQKILFRGADNPKKIKSTKVSKGYFKYVWYEEVDEFGGMEEIRTINQSLLRGGSDFVVFYSYNPPKSQRNWVNAEVKTQRTDRLVHHSTYLSVPPAWLGEQFLIEAKHLEETKPDAYKHEYLGEEIGTGGEVFTNITIRKISDDEIKSFDRIKRGHDWGYAADPLHYSVLHYDKTRRRIYIFFEIHKVGMRFDALADQIKGENVLNQPITADSAEPRSNDELKSRGIRVRPAKKGPGSVEHGIKFLQDLEEIIIDDSRCPNTAREFLHYELEKDNQGNWKDGFPDKDNHSIDSVRYALEEDFKRKPKWSFD